MTTPDPRLAALKERAAGEIAARRDRLVALSHAIHAEPELAWEEHGAAARVAAAMREAGFEITEGAYDVPTAVEAVAGTGDLTVALCAEYDALPGLGHACGHNVIAATGVGAAVALATVAAEAGLRVKLLGTPAEEHGGGKVAMLAAGAWEDADLSMMVHPDTGGDLPAGAWCSTAVERFEVVFTGRAAHTAATPEEGVNAGAAATLALTAIGLLRQHLRAETRVNAFVSHGGETTNIVPDRTVLQVEVRALDLGVWRDLKRRVLACFEGAAIATGCGWSWVAPEHAYAPVRHDETLAALWDANLTARGRSLTRAPITGGGPSTDMGNVSQVVPAIHPLIAILGETARPHTPGFTAAAVTPAANDALIDGAVALAWTALDVALSPRLRADFGRRRAEREPGATRARLIP